jgi:hypothetical protein
MTPAESMLALFRIALQAAASAANASVSCRCAKKLASISPRAHFSHSAYGFRPDVGMIRLRPVDEPPDGAPVAPERERRRAHAAMVCGRV